VKLCVDVVAVVDSGFVVVNNCFDVAVVDGVALAVLAVHGVRGVPVVLAVVDDVVAVVVVVVVKSV